MGKIAPLTAQEVASRLTALPGWTVTEGMLVKSFDTDGWPYTMLLVGAIACLAEAADHHPDLVVTWPRVTVKLVTHDAGGISERDLALAARIEATLQGRLVKPPA